MTGAIAWLWQGLLIAALTAILVRAMPRLNAATRHVIWWLALGAVLLQPWATTTAAPAASTALAGTLPGGAASTALEGLGHVPAPPAWLIGAALILYAGIVGFNLWRMAAGVRLIGRLKNGSALMPEPAQARLPLWSALRRHGRQAELRVSSLADGPCALGLGRPVILIPQHLATTLADHELDLIVAHEQAHLARYDDWCRLVQCALVAVAGLHPAVRLIAHQIDLEREAACDDRVVQMTGDPRPYARCLATVASLVVWTNPAATVAPHAVRSRGGLRSRVARLLDHGVNRATGLARSATAASLATLLLAVAAAERIPPLVIVGGLNAGTPLLSSTALAIVATTPGNRAAGDGPTRGEQDRVSGSMATLAATATSQAGRARSRRDVEPLATSTAITAGSARPPLAAQGSVSTAAANQQEPAPSVPLDSRTFTSTSVDSTVSRSGSDSEAPATGSASDGASDGAADATLDQDASATARLADRSVAAGQQVKRLGQSVGSSSRRAGTSVGRFFSRAGKSVVSGF